MRKLKYTDATVKLTHFIIVSYYVEITKLTKFLPNFLYPQIFNNNGKAYGMVSAVTFCDHQFRFQWMKPFYWTKMWQTNFRAYVIDARTNTDCVWFFQTMLGSLTTLIPRYIWKMPWYYARYNAFNKEHLIKIEGKSSIYDDQVLIEMDLNSGSIANDLEFMGQETLSILCNPNIGYYKMNNGKIGAYSIYHDKLNVKSSNYKNIKFTTFSRLGLLNENDLSKPHSVLYDPNVSFEIYLPPITQFEI